MLWEDFINSYWRDWRTGDKNKDRDKLDEEEWVSKWLKKHALLATQMPNDIELAQLKELRSLLWKWVQTIVQGESVYGEMLEQLNPYMHKGPVTRRMVWESDGQAAIKLLPLHSGWEQVMAEIAASFAGHCLKKSPQDSASARIPLASGYITMIPATVLSGTAMTKPAATS